MLTSRLKLLIRADAGPGIGASNVLRMLSLARAWQRNGGDVAWIAGELPNGLTQQIQSAGMDVYRLKSTSGDRLEARSVLDVAQSFQPDWISLAGAPFGESYQRIVASCGARLLVLDDWGQTISENVTLVLRNDERLSRTRREVFEGHRAAIAERLLAFSRLDQPTLTGQIRRANRTEVLSGAKFILLPDDELIVADDENSNDFPQLAHTPLSLANEPPLASDSSSRSRRFYAQARKILVALADTESENWTLRTLKVLDQMDRGRMVVDCVVGSDAQQLATLAIFKLNSRLNLRLHRNSDRLGSLVELSDLAICSSTMTCCDLLRSGIPTLLLSSASQNRKIPGWLKNSNAIVPVNFGNPSKTDNAGIRLAMTDETMFEQQLISALKNTLSNRDQRKRLSESGMQLMDGLGAQRIVREMENRSYLIRPATLSDAAQLYQWRNDPEVQSVSFTQDRFTFESHEAWLSKKLTDENCLLWIAEDHAGIPVGQLRFDVVDETTATVSVSIAQALRGRGLGKVLIKQGVALVFAQLPIERIVAQVKPLNAASERAFRHAGFVTIAPTTVNGKLANQLVMERAKWPGVGTEDNLQRSA